MTTASSLLAIATLPINLLIYLKLSYPSEEDHVAVDWAGLFTSLAVVVGGIVSGLVVGSRRPRWRDGLGRLGNLAGVSLILVGFFFSSNSSSPIWARDADFYLGVAVPCVFGLAVSLGFAFACGLPETAVPLRHHRDVLSEHRHPARGHTEQFQQLRRESVRVRGRRAVG